MFTQRSSVSADEFKSLASRGETIVWPSEIPERVLDLRADASHIAGSGLAFAGATGLHLVVTSDLTRNQDDVRAGDGPVIVDAIALRIAGDELEVELRLGGPGQALNRTRPDPFRVAKLGAGEWTMLRLNGWEPDGEGARWVRRARRYVHEDYLIGYYGRSRVEFSETLPARTRPRPRYRTVDLRRPLLAHT